MKRSKQHLLRAAVVAALTAGAISASLPALPVTAYAAPAAAAQEATRTVVLTGTVQMKAGAPKDWDPASAATRMEDIGNGFYRFTADLPAGTYYYKVAVGGSWAENYGLDGNFDGANVQLTLPEATRVTFYYNDRTHQIADSTRYVLQEDEALPILQGDGIPDGTILRDDTLGMLYQATVQMDVGDHAVKIMQQGEAPMAQTVHIKKAGPVSFYYDGKTRHLIVDDGSIHESELLHDTWDSAYRKPFEAIPAGSPITLSVAAGAGDVQQAKLFIARAKVTANGGDEYNPDFSAGTNETVPMKKTRTENGRDIWSVTIAPKEAGLYGYKFLLDDTKEYGDDMKPGHTGAAKLRDARLFPLTVYRADFKTPDWAKEAVTYQIFPDRFYNGDPKNDAARQFARAAQPIQHRAWGDLPANYSKTPEADGDKWECNDFFGGDIKGITKKLDYLQSLGITAIYVNPMSSASSNHRYDTVDYTKIDPILGTMDDFRALVHEMDKRHMHLIMDGVFNHVGDDSIYFDRYGKYKTVGAYEYWSRIYDLQNEKHLSLSAAKEEAKKELLAEGQVFSPYHFEDWFEIRNEKAKDSMGEKYAYHDWQGYDSLTPFADRDYPGSEAGTKSSDLGDYLLYGRDKDRGVLTRWFSEGLSGWRLDVAKEVPPGFWARVRDEVKKQATPDGKAPLLLGEIWQDGSQFLTGDTFDSVMNYKLSFALGDLFLLRGDAKAADEELTILRQNYPKEALYDLMNIVGSHDTVRAIYKFGGGKETVAQPGKTDFDYALGKARLKLAAIFLMGYPGMPTIYYGDEAGVYGSADPDCRRTYPWGKEDKELLAFYKKLIGIRNAHKALFAYGDLKTLKAEGDVYAYSRMAADGSCGIVALNRGAARTITFSLPASLAGTSFHDALTGYACTAKDGNLSLPLGKNQGMMLLMEK